MGIAQLPSEVSAIEKLREQDLEEARLIQSGMLPGQPLRTDHVLISHEFQPAAAVGGDYLDYFTLTDGTIGLYIGDVSGKGLPAAMYSALAVGTLRGVHKTGQNPGRVLSVLNKRLMLRGLTGRYTAIQYALLDPVRGELRIVSAGMPGPLLIRGNETRVLKMAGIPPGLFPDVDYEEFTFTLEPGDSVLFCTDGLTEARNANDQEFDLDGIKKVCSKCTGCAPLDLLGSLFGAIQEFTTNCVQWDDMTAAVLHYVAKADR
jgi:sigma-B regulation protein RsbU (phosphoserine phosphatase)